MPCLLGFRSVAKLKQFPEGLEDDFQVAATLFAGAARVVLHPPLGDPEAGMFSCQEHFGICLLYTSDAADASYV